MPYAFLEEGGRKRRALLVDSARWESLQDVAETRQRQARQAEAKARDLHARKILSHRMADTWENTVINMRKKLFEEMDSRRALANAEKERQYWEMRREEENIKEEIRKKARAINEEERDCTKNFRRVLLLSETLRGRNAQIKLEAEIREQALAKKMKEAEQIKEDVKKFFQEREAERLATIQKKKEVKKEAIDLFKKAQDLKLQAGIRQINEEREILEGIQKDIEEVERKEKMDKERVRTMLLEDIAENSRLNEKKKEVREEEDQEETEAIRIVYESKKRLGEIRKQKETEAQAANIAKRELIAKQVAAIREDNLARENESIAKAVLEKEKKYLEDSKKEMEHAEKLKQERINDYLEYKKSEEIKKQKEAEIQKWQLLQRYKKDEVNKEYDDKHQRDKKNLLTDNRQFWKKQVEECQKICEEERMEDVRALEKALDVWREHDDDFLKYADEKIKESRKLGRPLYPLEAVVASFKRSVGLTKRKPLSATWKSKVPINNLQVEQEFARREKKLAPLTLVTNACPCRPRNGIQDSC